MVEDAVGDNSRALLHEYMARHDMRGEVERYGAHGVAIAEKLRGGEPTGELALTFYVVAKQPADRLSSRLRIPETIDFLSERGDVVRITTDVVEAPMQVFEVDPETRIRPVPGGVSGGISGSTGTIGGWVWDLTDDSIVLLSNHHVLGDAAGTDILQQGTADGGTLPADKIGDVKRGVPRVNPGTNTIDASIGDPDDDTFYDLNVLEIGPAVYAIADAVDDMAVEKFGQTTEHTFGTVISTSYSTFVNGSGGPYWFADCIRVEAAPPSADWSDGGDSGSLVFASNAGDGAQVKPVIGLHMSGGGTAGTACKIQNVFRMLDLTTLCAGAFAAFLESLGDIATEVDEDDRPGTAQRRPLVDAFQAPAAHSADGALLVRDRPLPTTLSRRPRRWASTRRPNHGLARDVEARLNGSGRGRQLTTAVQTHRGELLTLLTSNGDVRRLTMAALRPVVAGAVTTDEVLGRQLSADDVARLHHLADLVSRLGSPELQQVVGELRGMLPGLEGTTLAAIFDIER